MRRIFQFDDLNGAGVLSVGECENRAQVVIAIHQGGQEIQLCLSEQAFKELADLRYTLDFPRPEAAPKPPLKAA